MPEWKNDEVKPWERQLKESVPAFQAFKLYCDLGAGRSYRRVAQELSKSDTLIKRWASVWEWRRRSVEYDNELIRQEFEEKKRAVRQMQERIAGEAFLLQKKAVKALSELQPEELRPSDILRFITQAAKLEATHRAASEQSAAEDVATMPKSAPKLIEVEFVNREREESDGADQGKGKIS